MTKKGNSFGTFTLNPKSSKFGIKPITSAFGGNVPTSISSYNRESAWARWRRGWELACANATDEALTYPFTYRIPLEGGDPESGELPQMAGSFKGFPTVNKELGIQWAGTILAGSLRFDNIKDSTGALGSISSITEDDSFWYVQLAGTWSSSNPLPSPLYVQLSGGKSVKPLNGIVLEDRIITAESSPITRKTKDPSSNNLYGYVSAVLEDVSAATGVITLRKQGSIEATLEGTLISPSSRAPNVNRFLMSGARYSCSCQDFSQRNYAYLSSLGLRKGKFFPKTNCAILKPGRYETVKKAGELLNSAMTKAEVDRLMSIVIPDEEWREIIASNEVIADVNRDFPGVFSDFGKVYKRRLPTNAQGISDSLPTYEDYSATNNTVETIGDSWTYLLDEYRYCKHIYAMKYDAGLFPSEPSDFPVELESIAEWEEKLVAQTEKEQEKAALNLLRYGLGYMDVPPYNCQSPMMVDMITKLLNIPASFISIEGFTMYDKNGKAYVPYLGESPES